MLLTLSILWTGCSEENEADAWGQFETDTITISAEASGVLKEFSVTEGEQLKAGTVVGRIDSVQASLQKKELQSGILSIRTNLDKLESQAEVYREQLETAQKELNRLEAMKEDNAATRQQLDRAEGQVNVLKKQIQSVEVQKQSVFAELETMQSRIAQIEDRIARAVIINPVEGTVLESYAGAHEMVSAGRPLYEIASLEELTLRVYISGAQLPSVRLGQEVEVRIDRDAESNEALRGTVSWIASEAEFTPRMIQTKEERVNQVYAVKIRVPNPGGKLKIGMPGEIRFN